jgi:hypothetical protein
MIKALSISVGVPLLIFGLGGSIFTILGIIDPAGTQLSNDADPFGAPPTLLNSILVLPCLPGHLMRWSFSVVEVAP